MNETITKEKALAVIKQYIQKNNTFNLFEIIQMRETSHTKLLAWLLDVNNKPENSLQFQFMKKFLEKINIETQNLNDFVKLLSEDVFVKAEYHTDSGNIDIFIYSKKANFVCVIENKIDAQISGQSKDEKSQVERYYAFVKNYNKYKNCEKKFVFFTKYLNKIKSCEQNLLDNFLYIPVEHSDTAEMISYALKNSFVDNIVKDALVQYRDFLQYNWYDTVDDIYLPYACSLVRESYSNDELSDDVKKVLNKFQPTPQIDALTC